MAKKKVGVRIIKESQTTRCGTSAEGRTGCEWASGKAPWTIFEMGFEYCVHFDMDEKSFMH